MCVICILEPGYTLPFEMLSRACHNNPHGYGVIIKRKEGLDIRKGFDPAGNDPEEIYKILKENEDAERVLHVRWKTHGDISEENTQPFEVFDDNVSLGKKRQRRHIAFAHNGTLGQYTPSYVHGVQQGTPVASDTLKFAREVLRPFLPILHGLKGQADISDPFVQLMLEKYWTSTGNRGILVCNDLPSFLFSKNAWEEIETSETVNGEEVTGKFLASNNDYFKEVKRGPLFEQMEKQRREKEAAERAARSAFNPSNQGKNESFLASSPTFYSQYTISEGLSDILEDFDMYKPEGYIQLANLTYYEWQNLIEKGEKSDVATMFIYLTDYLKQAHEKIHQLENPPLDEVRVG